MQTKAAQRLLLFSVLFSLLAVCGLSVSNLYAEQEKTPKPTPQAKRGEPFAVIEFFTSENCIRCKKVSETAETLGEASQKLKKNIYVLSYHIDYMNQPSWRDKYSKLAFSNRQLEYARAFNLRGAVAGQAIVNGDLFASGDSFIKVNRKVRRALEVPARAQIDLKAKRSADNTSLQLQFSVRGVKRIRREFFYFHAALVEHGIVRKIKEGPNTGHTFNHTNVVRVFETSRFKGAQGKGTLELILPEILDGTGLSLICFVQDPRNRKIIGAKELKLTPTEKVEPK